MMHVSRRAMACEFEIRFPEGDQEQDVQLALETLEILETLEEQISFFRPASEISRINLWAGQGAVQVEPELFRLLCLAGDIWRQTDGALDITSTALWQAWGFANRTRSVPSKEQLSQALSCVGFQYVEFDAEHNSIRFTRPGVQLNLGSMGKGFALDRCAAKLTLGGMRNFLLHAGQSSILACGSESGPGSPKGTVPFSLIQKSGQSPESLPGDATSDFWTIGVPHPRQRKKRAGEIRLRNLAIGTSSSQFQSFRQGGKLYGHIIDPRTGHPATDLLAATVIAPLAAMADGLSTAFYVLGLEKSLAFCQSHPEIGAVLLTPSRRGNDFEIHLAGTAYEDFTAL